MTDIVDRINHGIGDGWKALAKEAAAEIEQLGNLAPIVREQGFEIEQLRMQLADHGETITRLETEVERLRLAGRDLLYAIGHNRKDLINEAIEKLSRALEAKPSNDNEKTTGYDVTEHPP